MSRDVDMTADARLLEYPGESIPATLPVAIPRGFAHGEALQRIAAHVAILLENGMPEWEISKRLMRYHPAGEGV